MNRGAGERRGGFGGCGTYTRARFTAGRWRLRSAYSHWDARPPTPQQIREVASTEFYDAFKTRGTGRWQRLLGRRIRRPWGRDVEPCAAQDRHQPQRVDERPTFHAGYSVHRALGAFLRGCARRICSGVPWRRPPPQNLVNSTHESHERRKPARPPVDSSNKM